VWLLACGAQAMNDKNVTLVAVDGKPVVQLWDDERIEEAIGGTVCTPPCGECIEDLMHNMRDEYEAKVGELLAYINTLEKGLPAIVWGGE